MVESVWTAWCRELAFQISEQVEALGSGIGVRAAVVVGGIDMMTQALVLAKKPHVIIGTLCTYDMNRTCNSLDSKKQC